MVFGSETRSEICSEGRHVNLWLDELLVNLLELRAKLMLVCIRYTDALARGLAPTLGCSDLKFVDTTRVKELLLS